MIPHQCLGSVWSSKSRERDAATVVATIEQVSMTNDHRLYDDVGKDDDDSVGVGVGVGNDCVVDNGQASRGRQHQWW